MQQPAKERERQEKSRHSCSPYSQAQSTALCVNELLPLLLLFP
jgi:hypothetical protein